MLFRSLAMPVRNQPTSASRLTTMENGTPFSPNATSQAARPLRPSGPPSPASGNAAAVLGLAFVTEGAIPFAARDPLRVIPALAVGSALAGAISMLVGAELKVPHGGVFVLTIPEAATHVWGYLAAIAAGTIASTVLLGLFKRPLKEV